MSFFYLTPVKGDMPVYLLEIIITNRLKYLKDIIKGKESIYNEYLVEGGIYDNVGHFILCTLGILGNNYGFSKFLLQAEVELFKRRLESLSAYDLRCFSKRLLKALRKLERTAPFIEPLQVLCQHLILRNLVHHIGQYHDNNCCTYNIKIKFNHCLQLVAKRQVELRNGIAHIPCSKWKSYLITLFNNQLKYRLRNIDLTVLNNDVRIIDLLYKFKDQFNCFNNDCKSKVLMSKDVDLASKFFPPCMLNLHQYLRQKHRLSHMQRFYYSLYLKDIGMPVEEAIDFWRMEYKKMPNGSHSCGHTWDKDERKFIYGIRHLYGLEGGRKIYTSVDCQRIQNENYASSEGGCPFKSFESHRMREILESDSNEVVLSQINELKEHKQYVPACQLYLKKKFTKNVDSIFEHSFNFTPLKFYEIASKAHCN
ncbi:unnamed protein product [Parnassius mnemosyne]|uniref:DNA primase large subunit C-terminal domain-containing protein n=1 Tax=Parnassius mnemosyne TaxID=213953 RepID=A0AAV1K7L0_9NEOP